MKISSRVGVGKLPHNYSIDSQGVSELNRARLTTGQQPATEATSVTAGSAARRNTYRHVFAVNCAAGDMLLPSSIDQACGRCVFV
jgi:hypothetical protein